MIQINTLDQRYPCRTKDLLWYKEMRLTIDLIVKENRTLEEIKGLSEKENIFNAASASRANEIRVVTARRIQAVNTSYLVFFTKQNVEIQKILCLVMVLLTDRTFFEFMNEVFREKLITGDTELKDSDIIGFIHSVQEKDRQAAKWTDGGIKKLRNNIKTIMKEAGLISDSGTDRKIIRPIISEEVIEFLKEEGLTQFIKILVGARA